MTDTLPIGDLGFEGRRNARCKRLGMAVERAGSVVVSAPLECPAERIEAEARGKRRWVSRTLAAQELLPPLVVAVANAKPHASSQASAQFRQGAKQCQSEA